MKKDNNETIKDKSNNSSERNNSKNSDSKKHASKNSDTRNSNSKHSSSKDSGSKKSGTRKRNSDGDTYKNPTSAEEMDRELRRQRKARIAARKKREKQVRTAKILIAVCIVMLIGVAASIILGIKTKVTIELGEGPVTCDAFSTDIVKCSEVSGFDKIDYSTIGRYPVVVNTYGIKRNVTVCIADTTAPNADAVDQSLLVGTEVSADSFVTNITDKSSVKIEFQKKPDFTKEGDQDVKLILTDEGGNTCKLTAKLNMYTDTVAPVISGVKDIEAYVGDGISYKDGVTATDDLTKNVKLNVDNSSVNLNASGEYTIIYTATDEAGNTATETAKLTLIDKPEGYVEPEVVLNLANELLTEITTPDMSKDEIAYAIFKWTRYNIGYVQSDYKSSWTGGAYIGLTERSGDCYIFFSTAKALLTAAGIDNIDVVKQDTSHSRHYWSMVNLGTGWYHFDATNFASGALFFMWTDAELDEYSHAHNESHNRDKSLYPATPDEPYVYQY